MRMKAPCMNCTKRDAGDENRPNCHMVCEEYIAYNEWRETERIRIHNERKPVQDLFSLRSESVHRSLRKAGKK